MADDEDRQLDDAGTDLFDLFDPADWARWKATLDPNAGPLPLSAYRARQHEAEPATP